ncbi:MAG: cyclase family protein [Clostridia bacterium]|nr:cyclase family protein [Clostridia bacterium]
MKIYDISQEVFSCTVYPGDPAPERQALCRMEQGDLYNLTAFRMCAHNGTHLDAPYHFFKDGKTVEQLPLESCVGPCYVAAYDGAMTEADAAAILAQAAQVHSEAVQRILLKGNALVTEAAARAFADAGVLLLGVESQSVGPEDAPMAVHKILLGNNTVLLEGVRLTEVPQGVYLLSAAPLNLGGCDGAPCRAVLIELPASL